VGHQRQPAAALLGEGHPGAVALQDADDGGSDLGLELLGSAAVEVGGGPRSARSWRRTSAWPRPGGRPWPSPPAPAPAGRPSRRWRWAPPAWPWRPSARDG